MLSYGRERREVRRGVCSVTGLAVKLHIAWSWRVESVTFSRLTCCRSTKISELEVGP